MRKGTSLSPLRCSMSLNAAVMCELMSPRFGAWMGDELTDDKRSGSDPGSTANDGQDELSLEYWLERIS